MSRPLKILLLGDTSNFQQTLAGGLRSYGHDVTVASDGTGWMQTGRDIDLSRSDSKLSGAALWYRMRYGSLAPRLKGYDIVSLSGTHFARLQPARLQSIFDMVRHGNSRVFMTALATDTNHITECLDRESPIAYNEWRVGDAPTLYAAEKAPIARAWLSDPLRSYCRHLMTHVDGIVTALYEYHIAATRHSGLPADKIAYGGIPVNIDDIPFTPYTPAPDGKVRLFLGYPSARMHEKGAERLLAAARQLVADHPDLCTLDVASDIPLAEFRQRLAAAHVVIDQLYSYTPATTALMAMAMGKTVMSGGEEDYYRFINEPTLRPIVNMTPDDRDIYQTMFHIVSNPQRLAELSRQGRQLVERHNSATVVARRYIDFWSKTPGKK